MAKNKITTISYFLKRLRDNKFVALKLWEGYSKYDSRKWTILVDPGGVSLYITCYQNKDFNGEKMFEFNDGGNLFPKNFSIKTLSMEVIITKLIERGVPMLADDKDTPFYKER